MITNHAMACILRRVMDIVLFEFGVGLYENAIFDRRRKNFNHITPVLKSLHQFKINQITQYEVMSLTYKIILSNQPSSLSS
jgi:hypothetical protein